MALWRNTFLSSNSWWFDLAATSLTERLSRLLAKKTCAIHLGAVIHGVLVIITKTQIINKPRKGTDEPDQRRVKNGGSSYGKPCSISVPAMQNRCRGDGKCSEELYEMMQRSGNLDLESEINGVWSIGIIQEKLKQLAHALQWHTGEAISDSKRVFNPAKGSRKT